MQALSSDMIKWAFVEQLYELARKPLALQGRLLTRKEFVEQGVLVMAKPQTLGELYALGHGEDFALVNSVPGAPSFAKPGSLTSAKPTSRTPTPAGKVLLTD